MYIPLVVLLAACADEQALTDYRATVTEMEALVREHNDAVAVATSLDEIPALEASYRSGWEPLMADMDDEMERMDGCTMHARQHPIGMMDEAHGTMDGMSGEMDDHMTDHADHHDLADCLAEEADHLDAMSGMLGDMAGYGDYWHRHGMRCSGH